MARGDLTLGGGHSVQCTDDTAQKCTPGASMMLLLTKVILMHVIKNENNLQESKI